MNQLVWSIKDHARRTAAILVCEGERNLGRVSKVLTQRTWLGPPIGSLDTPFSTPQVELAFTN